MGERELQAMTEAKALVRSAVTRMLMRICSQQDEQLRDITRGQRRMVALGCATEKIELLEVRRMRAILDEIDEIFDEAMLVVEYPR